jgi:hypothetical protein
VVWVDGAELRAVQAPRADTGPSRPLALQLPAPGLEIVDTPYTDEGGTLHAVLASAGGGQALLVSLPPGAPGASSIFQLGAALTAPRAVLWSGDGRVAVAWADAASKRVFAVDRRLSEAAGPIASRVLFQPGHEPLDLLLGQRAAESGSQYERSVIALLHDPVNDVLIRERRRLEDGSVLEQKRFEVPGSGDLRVVDSALDPEGVPHYLFRDAKGGLVFAGADLGRLVPVEITAGKALPEDASPALVLTSEFSRRRGAYVRYLAAGHLVFRRLE